MAKSRKTVNSKGKASYSVSIDEGLTRAIDAECERLYKKDGIKRTRSSYLQGLAIKDLNYEIK